MGHSPVLRMGTDMSCSSLVFARKQAAVARPVDVGDLVEGTEQLLRQLLHGKVQLRVHAPVGAVWALADPGHLEQVLVNLVVNAQDAMPGGGPLEVRVEARWLGEPRAWRHGRVSGGAWAALVVRDAGCGMSEEVQAQLFEPFFTTKAPGRGTGLGLATVLRIAREAGGQVEVETVPGEGSTFTLWLPLMDPGAARRELARCQAGDAEGAARGAGRVWLVDDDREVRLVSARALRNHGFDVEAFGSAEEALQAAAEDRAVPDLLVAEAMLPGASGSELALRLQEAWPHLEVLFVSGDGPEQPGLAAVEPERVLAKPYGGAVLTAKVLALLGQA